MLHPDQFHEQLRMFIPVQEIHDAYRHDDAGPNETADSLYARKLEEAEGTGLADAVRHEGIQQPASIHYTDTSEWSDPVQLPPDVTNGHHRLAVAYAADPSTEIPVTHQDRNSFQYWREANRNGLAAGRTMRQAGRF